VPVDRRSFLKTGLGAGSLFLPLPYAWVWAQSEGAVKLLRLPKIALVLGNSKYKEAPLKNPANDAKAIGEALAATGFTVTTRLDATRAEMSAALDAYLKELGAKKCVGLFYYAGHGVQLQWKNYMLPVDAEIDTIDDVQKKAVEVNILTEGLTKAANPLNVIILDACRDNPFGTAKPTQAKGLSQMDAPTNTILAYATSPGNVASDGEGANGLYTENFLKEVKVPEAKLEDVFKRVRLSVRRRSNGAQIPWESTSLEEDFWFIPPKELKKLSEDEKERAFTAEAALWDRAKASQEPGPYEDYMRRYPSGRFTELAQLQLDRILARQGEKKVEIAKQEGNPFTKGTVAINTNCRIGDTYVGNVLDLHTRVRQTTFTHVIERISDTEVFFNTGLILDLMGNARRFPDGSRFTDFQNVPVEFAVGKHWTTRYRSTGPTGNSVTSDVDFRIVGRESVTVPAGTFNAFRIEGQGYSTGGAALKHTLWYDPERVRLVSIAREFLSRSPRGIGAAVRTELVSFKQA
jgi:hypothetical protein